MRNRAERLLRMRRPVILMYHRIGEPGADPWNLAVSPAHFAQHMAILARRGPVVPLATLAAGTGHDGPACAITFDDGYGGVIDHALPVLERHGFPATVFVNPGLADGAREFWWDELARLVLDHVPARVTGIPVIGTAPQAGSLGPETSPAERRTLHDTLWRMLRAEDSCARAAWLDLLAERLDCPLTMRPSHRLMISAEIGAARGLLEIGAHGMSHAALPALDPAARTAEIVESRDRCAAITGRPPAAFAYPFGDHDSATVDAVRDAGFACAVTVRPGPMRAGTDRLHLPRIEVRDWDGDRFARLVG